MPETTASSSGNDWVARLSPTAARAALLGLAVVAAILVGFALDITEPVRRAGPSDPDTYSRVIDALRAGQSYYPALHQALLDGGYGTLSPLNWRPPLFLTMLSWFPSQAAAQIFLVLVTVIAWVFAVAFAYRRGGLNVSVAAGLVMAVGLVSIVAPRAELSFEIFAGTLILISVSAYGLGWRWLGLAVAVLALFVRELAGVYVLVCLVLAMREKRWREVVVWGVAIVAYCGFYLWHMSQIAALIGPEDHAAAVDWLQLGGLIFVLRTASFNGVLVIAPYWFAALVLLFGLVGLKGLPRAAITVALYLLLFAFYGRPENAYWGALYTPLVMFGVAFAPAASASLFRRARGQAA